MAQDDEEVIEIRCFVNGVRKMTHEMTNQEALNFVYTATHLIEYLKGEYDFDESTGEAFENK